MANACYALVADRYHTKMKCARKASETVLEELGMEVCGLL